MKHVYASMFVAAAFAIAATPANAECPARMKVAQLQVPSTGGGAGSGSLASGSQTTVKPAKTASDFKVGGGSQADGPGGRRPPEDIIVIPDDPEELCCQIGGCGCD